MVVVAYVASCLYFRKGREEFANPQEMFLSCCSFLVVALALCFHSCVCPTCQRLLASKLCSHAHHTTSTLGCQSHLP